MKKQILAATAISLVIPLGGCSSLGIFDFRSSTKRAQAPAENSDLSEYFARRINDGKRHLAADRLGQAADAFRQASYDPQTKAEAFNGLAVTYDRLGRTDLAERFFKAAVKAAPMEFRFARNLARFEGKEMRTLLDAENKARLAKILKMSPPTQEKASREAQQIAPQKGIQKVALPKPRAQTFEEAFADLSFANSETSSRTDPGLAALNDVRVQQEPTVEPKTVLVARESDEALKLDFPADALIGRRTADAELRGSQATIVRVSRNQVKITRSAVPTGTETFTINRNNNQNNSAVIHISSSPVVADADLSGSDQTLALSNPESRTPLQLADAWNACKSGC